MIVVSTPVAAQAEGESKSWDFEIQPYILFSSIDGDAAVGRSGLAPVDVEFNDILRNLEFGAMVRGEAYNNDTGLGFILDYGFMELGADRAGPFGTVLDAEVRQGVLEALISHRSRLPHGASVDTYAGIRWWDIDLDLSLSPGPVSRNRSVDWVDPVFGMRVKSPIASDWDLMARVDFGGYGVASHFSWTTAVGVRHDFSDSVSLEFQYKALSVDYTEGRGGPGFFHYDTITHGPLLGLAIRF